MDGAVPAAEDARRALQRAAGAWRFAGEEGIAALAAIDVVEAPDPRRFVAELRRSAVDHIVVSALGASAHRGSWLPSPEQRDAVRIVVVLSGHLLLDRPAAGRALDPGGLVVHSPASALGYATDGPVRIVSSTLLAPTVPGYLTAIFPSDGEPAVIRAEDRSPTMAAFAAFLRPFASATLEPAGGGRALERGITDLALAVLSEVVDRLDLVPADRTWVAAHTTIEQRLADPGLDPGEVAAAVGVSARSLQAVFQHRGTSIARAIRERRVDTAARLLREEAADPGTAALATRLGFAGPDQFARAFRSRFGVPPGEYRARQRP